jgi:hypothetical protein
MPENQPVDSEKLFVPAVADRVLLGGPHSRLAEARTLLEVAWDFLRGFRALHFVGPCVTVFVLAHRRRRTRTTSSRAKWARLSRNWGSR